MLRDDLWVMGPYGVMSREDGPVAVPMRIVEDVVRQCRPAVVVGRYTARYLEQKMNTNWGLLYDERTRWIRTNRRLSTPSGEGEERWR